MAKENSAFYSGSERLPPPPFPTPQNGAEAKQNLVFFRDNSPFTQEDMAKKLGVALSTYGTWESNLDSQEKAITPQYIAKAAQILNCDPNLINPACPLLYKDRYNKYPPIKSGQDILFCNEEPKTAKEAGRNLNYFLTISPYSNKSLAEKCGFSESTITKWKSGINLNEIRAHKVAAVLGCPVELIYIQRQETPIKALKQEDLHLHAAPTSLRHLKENLAYHLANSGLSIQDLANKVDMPAYKLRNILDFDTGVFLTSEQSHAIASILGFNVKDVLISSIHVKAKDKKEHSFKSNVIEFFKIPADSFLFKTSIINFASGGKACDMPPSQCGETIASSMSLNQDSDLHGVCVIGDSMFNYETGKGIQSGFTVIVDASKKDVEQAIGKVVCIRLDGDEMIVKRLKRKNGVLYACSDNPAYEPQQLALPESAELMGTCVGMFSFSI